MFNKKKFEKLPERREWDHKINLTEEAPRELNAKAYAMTIKAEEALNQWLDDVRCGSHLRMKVHGVGSVMHRV